MPPGNRPLQGRSGYNQGPQSMPLTDTKFLGQPAVKCGAGDTTIFRHARVSPGENNVRSVAGSPALVAGMLFNRSGGPIEYDFVLVDDQNNEFLANPGAPLPLADGEEAAMLISPLFGAVLPIIENWTIKVRIITGNPSGGQGVVAWAWAHDKSRNFKPVILPLTTTLLEIGPAEGRAWQTGVGAFGGLTGEASIFYLNFDSVTRTVSDEILHLADEDIQVNSGVITIEPRVSVDSGVESAYLDTDLVEKGLIIAYPDTLKFRAGENQTSAPLYLFANLAEFDLPKDQG